ncbi:MAG: hypothetical protein V4850_30615 [Myxococcota bacterium]
MRTLILDTNALRHRNLLHGNVLAGHRVNVPVVVVQELLYQLSKPQHQEEAREALRHLHHAQHELRPDHDELIARSFGLPTQFWKGRERRWRSLIGMAASGASWPAIKAAWSVVASTERHTASADAFELWKTEGCAGFAADMKGLVEAERRHGAEAMESVAADRGIVLSDQDKKRIRRHLVKSVTTQELRRAWLLNQLAGLAGVVKIDGEDDAASDPAETRFMATYHKAKDRYKGGFEFALALYEQAHQSWMNGARPDENDFFDIAILLAVGDTEHDVFVTQERAWHRAAEAGGAHLVRRVLRVEDVVRT